MLQEVMDPSTGRITSARDLIGNTLDQANKLRGRLEVRIAEGNPELCCPVCGAPVVLRHQGRLVGEEKQVASLHFEHATGFPLCPLTDQKRRRLPEGLIRALKYQGQQESALHRAIKGYIADSLRCDPRFNDVAEERRRVDDEDPRRWRCPDVSARYDGRPIAFEIQLTTTFVSVMAARRVFYRDNGVQLVWVVSDFDPAFSQQTQDDAFYPNNNNLFMANADTLAASRVAGECLLDACWQVPSIRNGSFQESFERARIPFSSLHWDLPGQRIFYFDHDQAKADLEAQLAEEQEASRAAEKVEQGKASLRQHFWSVWERHTSSSWDTIREKQIRDALWQSLAKDLKAYGIERLPTVTELAPLLRGVVAVRDFDPASGEVPGWGYTGDMALLQVLFHFFHQLPGRLAILLVAMGVYGRSAYEEKADRHRKWSAKRATFRSEYRKGNTNYHADRNEARLIGFLFPELAEGLSRLRFQ